MAMSIQLRRLFFLRTRSILILRNPNSSPRPSPSIGLLSTLSEPPRNIPLFNLTETPHHLDSHCLLNNIRTRGFAKGRKSKEEADTIEVLPDNRPAAKAAAISQMEAALDALSRELGKLRTGRASAGMLDHIIVESYGSKVPLGRVAVVSVIDPQTLSVTPYDQNTLKELEHAIVSSPLGLNPRLDGQRLVATIPPLTKEHIQAICKVVVKSSEDVKQSIRRARQKALDSVKKVSSSISKDDLKRFEKEIDDLTKKFVKSAEDMCKAKEKEITGR